MCGRKRLERQGDDLGHVGVGPVLHRQQIVRLGQGLGSALQEDLERLLLRGENGFRDDRRTARTVTRPGLQFRLAVDTRRHVILAFRRLS